MKRSVTLILAILLFALNILPCALAENAAPRSSNFFTSYGTTLSNKGNGKLKIVFSTTGTAVCNQLGVASYEVQKLNDSGEWVDVSGQLSGSMGTNLTNYTFSRYFYGVSGETYRVQVTFFCIIGTAGESQTYTSGRITAN